MNTQTLAEFVKTLPDLPGVYRMLDAKGKILYVGKARNLKKRVKSYFQHKEHSPRITLMVKQIEKIEVTITRTEIEALILENNLIKSLHPKYNILFRDDKSYPYIRISAHPFPQISYYRGNLKKPHQYFGPYPNSNVIRESIQVIQKVFKIRTCENNFFNNRARPCLLFQIKRCSAPCTQEISQEAYAEDIKQTILFLNGKTDALVHTLEKKMETAATQLNFELAALYRDQMWSLSKTQQNQFIDGNQNAKTNIDILSCVEKQELTCVHWISIRNGRYVGDKSFIPENLNYANHSIQSCSETFIMQHYLGNSAPDLIISDFPISTLLKDALNQQSTKKIQFSQHVIGERKKWLNMAQKNALLAIEQRQISSQNQENRIKKLQQVLDLSTLNRIECFDISHTFGEATIGSCVVYQDFAMQPTQYRRYNITNITPGDDYAAMRQALLKRYSKLSAATNSQIKPDLVLIDGGKGQIKTALEIWQQLKLDIPLLGVAKGVERKAGNEELVLPLDNQTFKLNSNDPALHLIQTIRDEAHRFAITGHRHKRDKNRRQSKLDQIPLIGAKRKKALLMRFGGIREIESAGVEELMMVEGISRTIAEKVYTFLHH